MSSSNESSARDGASIRNQTDGFFGVEQFRCNRCAGCCMRKLRGCRHDLLNPEKCMGFSASAAQQRLQVTDQGVSRHMAAPLWHQDSRLCLVDPAVQKVVLKAPVTTIGLRVHVIWVICRQPALLTPLIHNLTGRLRHGDRHQSHSGLCVQAAAGQP
jgi:hypothetical protein